MSGLISTGNSGGLALALRQARFKSSQNPPCSRALEQGELIHAGALTITALMGVLAGSGFLAGGRGGHQRLNHRFHPHHQRRSRSS